MALTNVEYGYIAGTRWTGQVIRGILLCSTAGMGKLGKRDSKAGFKGWPEQGGSTEHSAPRGESDTRGGKLKKQAMNRRGVYCVNFKVTRVFRFGCNTCRRY